MKITFSNPRLQATIENWPSGNKRVTAMFVVESDPKKGERVSRTTTGKPKYTTYGERMCIVDGSDGRTYLLRDTGDAINIVSSDCQHDAPQELTVGRSSYFWRPGRTSTTEEEKTIYAELAWLLDVAHAPKRDWTGVEAEFA